MKQSKANRFQQGIAEIEKLDKELSLKISETIDFKDRNHFHVALIKIIDRPGEVRNDVKLNIQKFNSKGFEKIVKSFKFVGYTKLVLLHDPRENVEEVEEITTATTNQLPTPEEIEAEIERRANEKFQQLKDSDKGTETTNQVQTAEKDEFKSKVPNPFDNGTKLEDLKKFAKKHNIDLQGCELVKEIKPILVSWYNKQLELEQEEIANKQ